MKGPLISYICKLIKIKANLYSDHILSLKIVHYRLNNSNEITISFSYIFYNQAIHIM